MLKNEPAELTNNTYGPAVRTGTVSNPPVPGPTPPFPASTYISGATFGANVGYWSGNGDTWPSAWASDGSVYGWCCDSSAGGASSPMGLWRIDGSEPPVYPSITPVLVSNTPIDYTLLCASFGKTGSFPYVNVKPGGMMALPATPTAPNGTLLVGISCMNYGDDSVFNRQHNLGGFIASSTDGGYTWTNATVVGSVFTGRFSAPVFVSCGQANDACTEKDGGYIYAFFPGAFDNEAYWDNNDAMFLARVLNTSVTDAGAYEFFSGMDGEGAPTWTLDSTQAQPPIAFGSMIGENVVSYNPYLGRYLIANFGFIDNAGIPRPWHQEPYMSPHRTQLVLLEAPNPWGPWSMFFRSDDSPPAPGLYTPSFPSAFMQPIVGGKAQMVMFFACLDGAPNCRYTLNFVNVTLQLVSPVAAGVSPTDARQRLL